MDTPVLLTRPRAAAPPCSLLPRDAADFDGRRQEKYDPARGVPLAGIIVSIIAITISITIVIIASAAFPPQGPAAAATREQTGAWRHGARAPIHQNAVYGLVWKCGGE